MTVPIGAPVNGFPTSAGGLEDTANPLATGIFVDTDPAWISDPDSAAVTTHLTVVDGALAATAHGAATISGQGTNDLLISGSPDDVGLSLRSLTYTPPADFHGTRVVTVTTSDGSLSDTDTITWTIDPVPDAPQGSDSTLYGVEG